MRLSKDAMEELVWWQHHLASWNGRTVIQRQSQMKIQSDASLTGWGAVCDGVSTGGSWSLQERTIHINCLELFASRFSNEFLSEGASWNFSSTAIEKLHSSGIHKQPWRDCVTSSDFSSEIPVVMGPGERYSDNSPAHTRSVQHSSKLRIKIGERSIRLEAGSQSAPENQSSLWPTGNGPVCLLTHSPIASVLQLEVGPSIGSCGCISAGLEDSERICQSTLVSDWMCTQQDKSPGSSSNIGGHSVEGPSMVPSSPGDAERLSTAYSYSGISAGERGDPENPRNNSSVSRVACLRER